MRLRRKSKGLSWPFPWVENINCLNSSNKATKTKKERFENFCSDIRLQRRPRKPPYVIYIYRILEENLGAGFWDHAYKLVNELCKLMYVWATSIYCVRQYCWLIPYFEVWSWTMLQVWPLSCVLATQIWQLNLDSTFSSLKLKCSNDRSTVLY